ncbi:MAG: 30S ribosome-binding factor RbfA [Gammaproteobacteria bacterium]
MPKDFPRTRRVGDQIQRELAELMRDELKDPRLGMTSISAVEVSRDMSHAKVHVSVLGDAEQAAESVAVLNGAAGFLRHKLGKALHIRIIPRLHFYLDRSLEEGARIGALINRANAAIEDDAPDGE